MFITAVKSSQKGISLIESLIALLILSIGLIGMGAMFAKSLGVSHGSYMRSLASIQAMDMAERIRANVALEHDDFTYQVGEMADGEIEQNACEVVAPPAINCIDNRCSPEVLVQYDIARWCAQNTTLFRDLFSAAAIEHVIEENEDGVADAHYYTIGLEWNERRPGIEPNETGSEIDTIFFEYKMRL